MAQTASSVPTVYQHGGAWGLRSHDPRCLCVAALCRLVRLKHRTELCSSGDVSPTGELPVLVQAGTDADGNEQLVIGGVRRIAAYIRNQVEFDGVKGKIAKMNESTSVEMEAYWTMVEGPIRRAIEHTLWVNGENYRSVTRDVAGGSLPWPLCYVVPALTAFGIQSRLRWSGHTEETLYKECDTALRALSVRLGRNPYFYGDLPSEFDALLYGYLGMVMAPPLVDKRLRRMVEQYDELLQLYIRINTTCALPGKSLSK